MDAARPVGADAVKQRTPAFRIFRRLLVVVGAFLCSAVGHAQGSGYERTFPQSKAAIEKALTGMPTSGRLPVLDGFAMSADRPLERFSAAIINPSFKSAPLPRRLSGARERAGYGLVRRPGGSKIGISVIDFERPS